MGIVGTVADNASGVVGGNYQIFENFLNRSGASVHLKTEVSRAIVALRSLMY